MPDYDLIYRAYASKSQTNDTLVYAGYMQRPFQFNLATSTAKNLACVGHTSWYKINEFLRKFQILVYIWHISPQMTQC